jgi:hypothetical protein
MCEVWFQRVERYHQNDLCGWRRHGAGRGGSSWAVWGGAHPLNFAALESRMKTLCLSSASGSTFSTELKVGRVGAGWAGRSAEARAVAAGRAEAVECSGRTNVSKISPAVLARVCAAAADPQLLYCGRMGPAVPVLA